MKFKESVLTVYASPLSATEDSKCKHAIEEIRDALKTIGYSDDEKEISLLESDTLSYSIAMRSKDASEKIQIFVQGSYANNTCVRNESDVDIAIVREDLFEYAFGERFSGSNTEHRTDAMLLKAKVESVLRSRFPGQVHRGNKSIKVDGNTYRKKADTVPCLSVHYFYRSHLKDYLSYKDGVIIYADDGSVTVNYPKQHIANGKAKNNRTNHYYKKMVRIMKKMRILMSECGYSCADKLSSFGLESLLWNLPDQVFLKWKTLGFEFEEIIQYLSNNKSSLSGYLEANGIKPLCPTKADEQYYADFIDTLKRFFEYDYGS